MPVPSPRNKILPARGNYADLASNVASILDGEICYAIDQDQYYQNEGGTLVAVGATKAQGLLADSAVQPGDNVSTLANDAGYITLAEVPADAVTSVNTQTGAVVLDKADVGLGNVDNTSDADKPVSTATQTALNSKADLVGGFVPTSQIPAIAITEFLGSVGSEAAMLALTGQQGDWCLRTDKAVGYVIVGADPSLIANWEAFTVPGSAVTSINSQVGDVVLGGSDVGLSTTDDLTEGTTNLYSQWSDATGGIDYSSGNVGINETSPSQKLEVNGGVMVGKGGLDALTKDGLYIGHVTSDVYSIAALAQGSLFSTLTFQTTAADSSTAEERVRITQAGRMGIGTSAPSGQLHIEGGTPQLIIDNPDDNTGTRFCRFNSMFEDVTGASAAFIRPSGSAVTDVKFSLRLGGDTTSEEVISALPTGEVGIGIANPSEALDVNGTVRATGFDFSQLTELT